MGDGANRKLLIVCSTAFLGMVTLRADTLVMNFAGLAQSTPDRKGSPPDTMGSFGPNIFFETLNSQFQADTTTSGAPVEPALSEAQFWANAGIGSAITGAGPGLSDARVVYDPSAGRPPPYDGLGIPPASGFGNPFPARQRGDTRSPTADTGDPRFHNTPVQVGNLVYLVRTVGSPTGYQDLLDWSIVDVGHPNVPVLVREGHHNDLNIDSYYASIAANSSGDFAIAFNGSGPAAAGSAGNLATYYQVCRLNGEPCEAAEPTDRSAVSDFGQTFGAGVNRWGNFSATVIDPNDQYQFRTVQGSAAPGDPWAADLSLVGAAVPAPAALLVLGAGVLAGSWGRRWRRAR